MFQSMSSGIGESSTMEHGSMSAFTKVNPDFCHREKQYCVSSSLKLASDCLRSKTALAMDGEELPRKSAEMSNDSLSYQDEASYPQEWLLFTPHDRVVRAAAQKDELPELRRPGSAGREHFQEWQKHVPSQRAFLDFHEKTQNHFLPIGISNAPRSEHFSTQCSESIFDPGFDERYPKLFLPDMDMDNSDDDVDPQSVSACRLHRISSRIAPKPSRSNIADDDRLRGLFPKMIG